MEQKKTESHEEIMETKRGKTHGTTMQKQAPLKKRHGLTDINSYSSHALSFLQGAGPPLEYLAIVALRTAAGVLQCWIPMDSVLSTRFQVGRIFHNFPQLCCEGTGKATGSGPYCHNQWMGFPI